MGQVSEPKLRRSSRDVPLIVEKEAAKSEKYKTSSASELTSRKMRSRTMTLWSFSLAHRRVHSKLKIISTNFASEVRNQTSVQLMQVVETRGDKLIQAGVRPRPVQTPTLVGVHQHQLQEQLTAGGRFLVTQRGEATSLFTLFVPR